jgi:hypothetical protein
MGTREVVQVAVRGWEGSTKVIYVMTLTGKTIILPVKDNEIIDSVKSRIRDEEGVPNGEKMITSGKYLLTMFLVIVPTDRPTTPNLRW